MASTSSSTSSPLRPHMDVRGFLFVLPRLGVPDPHGEWHTVKAAIGKKSDVVELVLDPSIPTPVHSVLELDEMAPMGVDIGGVFWILLLLKPTDPSPTAPPEFFSIGLKRAPASAVNLPAVKLPANTEWVFCPMSIYEQQMSAVGLAPPLRGQKKDEVPAVGGGTAEHVRKWKDYAERAKRDVNEQEAQRGDIIDSDWSVPTLRNALVEATKRGDSSKATTADLKITIRLHPAPGGDFKTIDYAVRAANEPAGATATIPEEEWKPLPPHASRPDGDRKLINVGRVAAGKPAFSKEEWVDVRAAQQQKQEPSRLRATMLHDQAL